MKRNPITHHPFWRRPVVLWSGALLLVAMIVAVMTSTNREPQSESVELTQSAGNGADLQWPDLKGTAKAPVASDKPKYIVPEGEAPGRTFIAKLNLRPRLKNGRLKGYIVEPADPSILEGTPLQPGDVLLEMDGLVLDPVRVAALAQNIGDYQDVFIRFERGSSQREDMLPLGKQ